MGKNSTKSYGYLWCVEYIAFTKEQEKPDGNFPTAPYPNPEDKSVFNLALDMAKEINYIGEKIKEFEETNINSFILGLEESYGYNK